MSRFIGRRVNVGLGKEATRGVGVAATQWIPHSSLSFFDKCEQAYPNEAVGSISMAPSTLFSVLKWAEGNIEGEINANSFGLLLVALLGTDTPASSAPAYTHAYTILETNQHPSLSIFHKTPDETMHFELGMIDTLEIKLEMGKIAMFTAGFMSKSAMSGATATKAYARDYKFVSRDLTFKVANTIGDIASASKISLKALTLKFEKNIERDHILGSFDPEDILNKGMRISGSIELMYEATTWKDYMANGSIRAMEIKLQNSRVAIGALNPKLDIIFPKVAFSEWEPTYDIDEIVSQKINFNVLYDLTNSRLWSTFDLVNSTSSY